MFKIGDKVRVVKPIISGYEGNEGEIKVIDNGDDNLPIKVEFYKFGHPTRQDFHSLYFNERELMLID